jgi:hypothetical protein
VGEELLSLYQQWLGAFEQTLSATGEEEKKVATLTLTKIEARIAETPAEGAHGLVVKLGLHCFLTEHADSASEQFDSAYADLVRMTGLDPAAEISTKFCGTRLT